MASIAAFVYFWSSAYEVSGGCATDTLYPSFLRMLATAFQPEPSAKAPCTRTTFLICCFTTILLCSKDPLGRICRRRPYLTLVGVCCLAGFCLFCRFLLQKNWREPAAFVKQPQEGHYSRKFRLVKCRRHLPGLTPMS